MIRFTTIINAARHIVDSRQRWNEQEGPNIFWGGALTKQISEDLDIGIRTACDATADEGEEIEEKSRGLILAIDDVAYAHQRWLQDASMGLPTAPPRGSDELHRVIDRLEEQLKSSNLPAPPPIDQLQKQKVSPNQIAVIYGWKTADGSPDTTKVFEEINKPGTHYKESKWVHPSVKAIQREIDQRWSTRQPRPKLFSVQADGTVADGDDRSPLVPTLDELLAVKAPIEQIMRLHDMSEEDVLEAAKAAGVDLNEQEPTIAATQLANQANSQAATPS